MMVTAGRGCIRCQSVLTHQIHLLRARVAALEWMGACTCSQFSPMSHGLISVNDCAAAECGREIQINILVHIINAPPTSSPRPARLLGIIRYILFYTFTSYLAVSLIYSAIVCIISLFVYLGNMPVNSLS